nr:MAG TPA: hypothetical protein [Caudoviricetes sp.]
MATKMNAATAKRVKALGINVKTEEEAREKLLAILDENGIEEMEGEDTDTLLDIAETFVDDKGGDDDDSQTEEEENDELAEEVEEEEEDEKPKKHAKKASKKVEEPEEEEEDEDEEETEEEEEDEDEGDQFDEMDRSALKAYIKENELDITVKKSMSDDDIREAIRAEVGEEEEEDEKPAPKAKASTKTAEKPAPKKEEKKAPAKSDKKADKKEAKPAGKRGTKLDPKNNEDDRKAFAPLKKLFPESEYAYAWVASAGVTIKHKGKNSQRSMVLIENCSKQADGSIKCNLYLLTFTKQTDILDKAGIDYEPCWSGAPLIKGITLDEAIEIITDLMEHITATVQKIDKKLGENRKKMEESLDKKKPAKKAAKVEEPEEEEDEDDEEEEEAPKKKTSKVAPKKAAKKVVEEDEEEEEDDEEEDEAPAPKKKATSKVPAKKTTKKK